MIHQTIIEDLITAALSTGALIHFAINAIFYGLAGLTRVI